MKLPPIISIAAAGLCLVLSIWLYFANGSNQSLQSEVQRKNQDLQTETQQLQQQQRQLQAQQETINAGTTLAQQVGPAVLRDLGALAVQNKNAKITELLQKYGLQIQESAPASAGTEAPKTNP